MSNALLNEVRKLQVKGPGKAVLIVLSDRADDAGRCWPSYSTIASETGLAESTVRKHVPLLRDAGWLRWQERFTTCGDKDSNLYTLTLGGGPPHGPPTPPDGPQVGRHTAEGGPPRSGKASIEAPMEAIELFDSLPKQPKPDKSRATLEEVVSFVKGLGLPESDGVFMFYKWEGNGWTNGSKVVKNWKSQIRSWMAASYLPSQKANGSNQQPAPNIPTGSALVGGRLYK